jgi:hypothetical protein
VQVIVGVVVGVALLAGLLAAAALFVCLRRRRARLAAAGEKGLPGGGGTEHGSYKVGVLALLAVDMISYNPGRAALPCRRACMHSPMPLSPLVQASDRQQGSCCCLSDSAAACSPMHPKCIYLRPAQLVGAFEQN